MQIAHDRVVQVRAQLDAHERLWVRIDAAGDYVEFLKELSGLSNTAVLTKARMTPDLLGALALRRHWRTVDTDASGRPTVQVATVDFQRACWKTHGVALRVVAVRSTIRECGQRTCAWGQNDDEVQALVTHAWDVAEEDPAKRYTDRAGIEPWIGQG